MAFVGIDCARLVDRLDLAFLGAGLTGSAAFAAPAQPVHHAQSRRHAQGRAERADILAVELAVEHRDHHQTEGVGHERQLAIEAQGDGGLERLDLRIAFGGRQRLQRNAEQHQQNEVLDPPQAVVQHLWQVQLRYPKGAGDLIDQFPVLFQQPRHDLRNCG